MHLKHIWNERIRSPPCSSGAWLIFFSANYYTTSQSGTLHLLHSFKMQMQEILFCAFGPPTHLERLKRSPWLFCITLWWYPEVSPRCSVAFNLWLFVRDTKCTLLLITYVRCSLKIVNNWGVRVFEWEDTVNAEHMAVILVRVDQEWWFPGVPLASIIHVLEGLIAQPMFGYRQTEEGGGWGVLNLALILVWNHVIQT